MSHKIVLDGKRMQFVADVIAEGIEKYGIDAFRNPKEKTPAGGVRIESINRLQQQSKSS